MTRQRLLVLCLLGGRDTALAYGAVPADVGLGIC